MQEEFEDLRMQLLDLLWESSEDAKVIVEKMKRIDREWKRLNKKLNKISILATKSSILSMCAKRWALIEGLKLEIKRLKEVGYE